MSRPVSLPPAPNFYDPQWERQIQSAVNSLGQQRATVVNTPANGASIQIPNGAGTLLLTPLVNLNNVTVTLPASVDDGFEQHIASTANISQLTINVSPGQTIQGGGTISQSANTEVVFRYVAGTKQWYRVR